MLKNHLVCCLVTAVIAFTAMPACALDLGGVLNKEQLDKLNKAISKNPEPAPSANAPSASATELAKFSTQDQIGSLKQALTQGAEVAVKELAKTNGYLGNDKVRIPLPESLKKPESLLRKLGMGKYADDLITSINHAAEAAVPEAKTLLVGAVKNMSIDDAKTILTGNDDAATQYFRKNTEAALTDKFKPIIAKSMQKVKLAEKYDQLAEKGAQFGLVDERDVKMDDYITRKAMDGLFLMMAEQEKIIRENPLQATGNLAKKIFSAIKY